MIGGFALVGGFAQAIHHGLGAGFEIGDQGFGLFLPFALALLFALHGFLFQIGLAPGGLADGLG